MTVVHFTGENVNLSFEFVSQLSLLPSMGWKMNSSSPTGLRCKP